MTRARALAVVALALGMGAYCLSNLRVGTDLMHFMPDEGRSELASLLTRLADSSLTRTMAISVGAPETERAVRGAAALADRLAAHPEVEWLRSEIATADLQDLYELYFPRRYHFLSDDPEREVPELLAPEALRQRAELVRRRLYSPASSFLDTLVSEDPLGAFERTLERLRAGAPGLVSFGGQLVTEDGRHAILLLGTRASAFDSGRQRDLVDSIERWSRELAEQEPTLRIEVSGANRFAVSAERGMKDDVYAIAAFSFLGVAALFVAFVASLRGFLLVAVPTLCGLLIATTAGIVVFGDLDGLTMAFGASLMGIAIDYANHLLIHHGLAEPPEDPARTARRLRPTLTLGALTTIASFGGLATTAFPAFRQMSFFAAVGVAGGLLASLYLLPALLRFAPPLPARSGRTAEALSRLLLRIAGAPRVLLLSPLALALLALPLLPRLLWTDDMSQLTRFDPALLAEDRRVRSRVSQLDTSRFVVGVAADDESLLRLSDRIHTRLGVAVGRGALDGVRSVHDLVWSADLQRRNLEQLRSVPDLDERVVRAFEAEGFRADAVLPLSSVLEAAPPPLSLAELRDGPVSEFLLPYVLPFGDEVAVVAYLHGLREPEVVRDALADLEGVRVVDQKSFVDDVYAEFRRATVSQMLLGAVLVLALLMLRYRAVRPVLAAFAPSALVAILVLALFAATGVRVNLLHVMSLVMVTGMGVDYGVFLVDSAGDPRAFGATMLSLLLSCLTTAFVFGALSFSTQPALQAIGITTAAGILLSYVLAPVALGASGMLGRPR